MSSNEWKQKTKKKKKKKRSGYFLFKMRWYAANQKYILNKRENQLNARTIRRFDFLTSELYL